MNPWTTNKHENKLAKHIEFSCCKLKNENKPIKLKQSRLQEHDWINFRTLIDKIINSDDDDTSFYEYLQVVFEKEKKNSSQRKK